MFPSFADDLLKALLDCMPDMYTAPSAGALHWFFLVLNRVKGMDAEETARVCTSLLFDIAKQLNDKTLPEHTLLAARCVISVCISLLTTPQYKPPLQLRNMCLEVYLTAKFYCN